MTRKPNIIYIYADDLGRGMLSCYGQQIIQTPNIDRISNTGIQFTCGYGASFCAPARASFLTGLHDCHDARWTFCNGRVYQRFHRGEATLDELSELICTAGLSPSRHDVFLAEIAQAAGYVTGEIGKLEWGFATTDREMRRHGWDYHYGYYDHVMCHGFFPMHLFENGEAVRIKGNNRPDAGKSRDGESLENYDQRWDMTGKATYSQDLFDDKIIEFIRKNRDNPFFLFHPSQLPHGPICVTEIDPAVKGNPLLTPYEQEYATMVLRLDQTVGLILDELDRLGLREDTMVIFAADNGHEVYTMQPGRSSGRSCDLQGNRHDNITTKFNSESCGDVFNGNDGFGGLKFSSWEGGLRIPFVANWPGRIDAGSTSDLMFANYDFMPTMADLLSVPMPDDKDGISILPTLLGDDDRQKRHDAIYCASPLGPAVIGNNGWKLRSINCQNSFQLYRPDEDRREENDLASEHPEVVEQMSRQLIAACDGDLVHGTPDDHRAKISYSLNKQEEN